MTEHTSPVRAWEMGWTAGAKSVKDDVNRILSGAVTLANMRGCSDGLAAAIVALQELVKA